MQSDKLSSLVVSPLASYQVLPTICFKVPCNTSMIAPTLLSMSIQARPAPIIEIDSHVAAPPALVPVKPTRVSLDNF